MDPTALSPSSKLSAPLRWLLGLALLCAGLAASAQQDPPGRIARLNLQQGTVSFAPAGDDSWYDAQPNRPITTGDRLWTDRNARAELYVGSAALRLDGQTHVEFSEIDDDTARITSNQGNLQLRVRDDLAGQRVEIDTGNLAVVIDAPGEYRIASDPAAGTTWVAVASGRVTLHGENGEQQSLGARQQLTVSGRNLETVAGAPSRTGAFDTWVAERDRLEDQSVSARYVSREVVGYQQLDAYGDWQNDASYGDVWFPRNVDADWAPYRDGQWVNVAPWGLTWVDAAPWGFAPSHYGRWARVGPRWGWVPGRTSERPVYSPALVGFVGGGNGNGNGNAGVQIGNGSNGVGWFPLAPGEQWRPGFRASERYVAQVNRAALQGRPGGQRNDFYANQQLPGAMSVLPAERFGRGAFGRRDLVRLPDDRFARGPVAPTPGISVNGFGGGFGRPAAVVPPAALIARQQQIQFQQAQQAQQGQQQWAQQQRAAQAAQQQQQQQQQRQEWRQRGEQERWQQQQQQQQQLQLQQQQALRQQQELQQRAAQAQAQQQQQQQQQQQLFQQQQVQQMQLQQQRAAQQQALAQQQQQALAQQQQLRAAQLQQQMQQQVQAQQQAQQNAMRQAQEAQLRGLQQQRGIQPQAPGPQPQGQSAAEERRRLMTSPDSR